MIYDCSINGIWLKIEGSFPFRPLMDIYLSAKIDVFNPNLVGSWIDRARFDLFITFSRFDVRRIGEGRMGIALLPSRRIKALHANVHINDLDLYLAFKVLHELWNNDGVLNVRALGFAQVRPHTSVVRARNITMNPFLVAIQCTENIRVSLRGQFISLVTNPSRNCVYTYDFLSPILEKADDLPTLDRSSLYV